MTTTHRGQPGPSPTDRAADAAFAAIDTTIREGGYDPRACWAIVMVMIPGGQPTNATVAADMPNPTSERMLQHALTQLEPLAAECGLQITTTTQSN